MPQSRKLGRDDFLRRFAYLRSVSELDSIFKCYSDVQGFVIDGFPRSGNTYFVEAAQYYLSIFYDIRLDQKCIHHFHDPGLMLQALHSGLKTFLLIRNPMKSVISSARYRITHDLGVIEGQSKPLVKSLIETEASRWLRFADIYHHCSRHESLCTCLFDGYAADPSAILTILSSHIGLDLSVAEANPEFRQIMALDSRFFLGLVEQNSTEESKLRVSSPSVGSSDKQAVDQVLLEEFSESSPCLEAICSYHLINESMNASAFAKTD